MLFPLFFCFIFSESANDIVECSGYNKNCETCFSNGLGTCGWCSDSTECLLGTNEGPINKTCAVWMFKFDMKCHLESTEPLSLGVRIGVSVFSSIVAVGTAIFWICIFPMCSAKPKAEEDPHPDYQIQ